MQGHSLTCPPHHIQVTMATVKKARKARCAMLFADFVCVLALFHFYKPALTAAAMQSLVHRFRLSMQQFSPVQLCISITLMLVCLG